MPEPERAVRFFSHQLGCAQLGEAALEVAGCHLSQVLHQCQVKAAPGDGRQC